MKKLIMKLIMTLLILICFSAQSQNGGEFEIVKSVIGNGGGISSGGEFEIIGTIGQPILDNSSSGEWQIEAGFWNSSYSNVLDLIFKDSFENVINATVNQVHNSGEY